MKILVFRQSSIDRFLKLEVPGIQEIPASATRQLKMDGTLGAGITQASQVSRLILRFGGSVSKYHPKPLCGRQLWRDFGLSDYLI